MQTLPIHDVLDRVFAELADNNTLILQAPPGAGKSTVLPLALLDAPWLAGLKILMLEPRRLAARSVAERMAFLKGEEPGKTIGYRVRFENKTGPDTRLEVLTEGILTRLIQQDATLEKIGLVIFDEFHERSLQADLALALCREVQQLLRPDLRILMMSATLQTADLAALLGNAPVITSQGRQYPVETEYLGLDIQLSLNARMGMAVKKAVKSHDGDMLVFLPGTGEILRLAAILEEEYPGMAIRPLYGDLPPAEQQKALQPDPTGRRKIVLATSIAETSLTIEGIKVVIDSGLSRTAKFHPRSGLTRMETLPVSKDAADQRAGRAGRLGPGICYRLWSEVQHTFLPDQRKPEILEADLAPVLLETAQWGKISLQSLAWLTPPPPGAEAQAAELLHQLEGLKEGKISAKGSAMLRLPTHPRLSHMLLVAEENDLLALATDVAAVLEERDPLEKEAGTNLSLRVQALRDWRTGSKRGRFDRIEKLASSWRKIWHINTDNTKADEFKIGFLLAAAYPERVAKQLNPGSSRYRLAGGHTAQLPEHDPLVTELWLSVAHLDAGQGEGRIFLAAPVDPGDLLHLQQTTEKVQWNKDKGVLEARSEIHIGSLVVKSSPLSEISADIRIRHLCEAVEKEGLSIFGETESTEKWQARVLSLCLWNPEGSWPDVSDEWLLENVEKWLTPYLQGVKNRADFKKLDLQNILNGLLPWPLPAQLDELAPQKLKVPSGFEIPLEYFHDGRKPVLAVRLQEMFGLLDTPAINAGKTAVLLHLLSPGYKPIQVTQDLRSFWQNTYPEVRKELRTRYPKHSWPEDPWTAEAVRGVKKLRQP